MSPLACLLFALAAVFATAHGYCTIKHVGRRTDIKVNYETVYFYPPGVRVDVDSQAENCPQGMHVVGEDIKVCNVDPNGPAPHINGPDPPSWSYDALCSEYECPTGGSADTTQYCDY